MVTLEIDTRDFNKSLIAFAENSKKDGVTLLRDQARLLVRDMIYSTPPNKDNKLRPGAVRTLINADMARTGYAQKKFNEIGANYRTYHKSKRSKRTGRVHSSEEPLPAAQAQIVAAKQRAFARVGRLAGGWNGAAIRLGTKVPAWIARHGMMGGGAATTKQSFGAMIHIYNAAVYPGVLQHSHRLLKYGLKNRERQMMKQVDHFINRSAKKNGFTNG